jgi:hypothetical protein
MVYSRFQLENMTREKLMFIASQVGGIDAEVPRTAP